MCKIMILTGIQDSKLAMDFMKSASVPMSVSDRDGIGYSAINSRNELFMERWHQNSKFLDTETVITKEVLKELEPFKSRLPDLKVNYGSFGNVTRDDLRTVTMHTRMATCGRTFENVHPFVDKNISLIHNGVINNADQLCLNKISTCDSEVALQLYINAQLNLTANPDRFQKDLVDKLKGYWAFGILAKGLDGQYVLDVVREGATLYWTTIPEIGENCTVFATTMNIIESSIASLGLPKREKIYLLTESDYHRFNALTGEYLFSEKIDESTLNKIPRNYYSYGNSRSYTNKYSGLGNDEKRDYSDPHYYRDYDVWEDSFNENFKSKEELTDETNDDMMIESFYDTSEPLVDRLSDFDTFMMTSYLDSYENLPIKTREFLERKEEEGYLIFDDILKVIEDYNTTKDLKTIVTTYKELKRA